MAGWSRSVPHELGPPRVDRTGQRAYFLGLAKTAEYLASPDASGCGGANPSAKRSGFRRAMFPSIKGCGVPDGLRQHGRDAIQEGRAQWPRGATRLHGGDSEDEPRWIPDSQN